MNSTRPQDTRPQGLHSISLKIRPPFHKFCLFVEIFSAILFIIYFQIADTSFVCDIVAGRTRRSFFDFFRTKVKRRGCSGSFLLPRRLYVQSFLLIGQDYKIDIYIYIYDEDIIIYHIGDIWKWKQRNPKIFNFNLPDSYNKLNNKLFFH